MTTTERAELPIRGTETEIMLAFLAWHRDTLRIKTEGLTSEQLNAPTAATTMTLGGLLKHMAMVEDNWFSVVLMGNDDAEPWRSVDWEADNDWEWHTAADDSPEELRALFDEACAASEAIVAEVLADPDGQGFDRLSVKQSRRPGGGSFDLRWIVAHMVEEYARHNGHADLLREAVDGVTGQ